MVRGKWETEVLMTCYGVGRDEEKKRNVKDVKRGISWLKFVDEVEKKEKNIK